MQRQKLNGVQWLRAVAAIGVVAFHASARSGGTFLIGEAGVDVFFVISGFIMWTISEVGANPAGFLKDRIVRIVPLYWIATAIMCLGASAHLFPRLHINAVGMIKSLFFIPYYSDGAHIWPILVPGWTLDYEMAFYLIFAALLLCLPAARMLLLYAILMLLVVLGTVFRSAGAIPAFFANSIVLEFAIGCTLGWYFKQNSPISLQRGLVVLAAALCTIVFTSMYMPSLDRTIEWGLPAALLVAGVVALEKAGVSFAVVPIVFLGDASYSIYLFHDLGISVAVRVLSHEAAWMVTILGISFGILLGCVVHVLLEKPILRALRRLKAAPDAKRITQAVLGAKSPVEISAKR
jgi:exopolysaccharide production protein ExoZ